MYQLLLQPKPVPSSSLSAIASILFLIVFIVIIFVVFKLISTMDKNRIETFIHKQGGTFISKKWSPFGKGWFGDKSNRIYEVIYIDKSGNKRQAFTKTSIFSGVYFTDDKIIETASKEESIHDPLTNEDSQRISELEIENQLLKEEINRLKNKSN